MSTLYGKHGLEVGWNSANSSVDVIDLEGYVHEARLDEDETVNLAMEMLADSHDFQENFDGSVTLLRKPSKPVVGDFYRVDGDPEMTRPWCDSPVAKIVEIERSGDIVLETIGGDRTSWGRSTTGLIKVNVKIQEEWVVQS